MTETQKQNLDEVPESNAAKWAYRCSFIPIFGVPVFIILGVMALAGIAQKGIRGLLFLNLEGEIHVKNRDMRQP